MLAAPSPWLGAAWLGGRQHWSCFPGAGAQPGGHPLEMPGCIMCPTSSETWLSAGLGILVHFFHFWDGVSMPGFFFLKNYTRGETAVRRCSPPGTQHFSLEQERKTPDVILSHQDVCPLLSPWCEPLYEPGHTPEPSLGPPTAPFAHREQHWQQTLHSSREGQSSKAPVLAPRARLAPAHRPWGNVRSCGTGLCQEQSW